MIAGINSIFAGGGLPYRVTIGLLGSPFFEAGYSTTTSSFGSINLVPQVNGEELLAVFAGYSAGGPDLVIQLDDDDANAAQDDFTGIVIEDGTGVIRTYLTADADIFNSAGNVASWSWGSGADEVWSNSDSGEVRGFAIIP